MRDSAENRQHKTYAPATRRALLGAVAAAGAAATLPDAGARAATKPSEEQAAYKLGLEAYVYGFPLIYFAKHRWRGMMVGDPATKEKHRWGAWLHRNLVVAPDTPGSPQTDTLYAFLWLELTHEPFMLRIPKIEGRYWSVHLCDLLGETFALPTRRTYKKEEWVAIVGPDWNGSLPSGVSQVYRSPTRQGYGAMRMFFDGTVDDRERAYLLQKEFTLKPLSAWTHKKDWVAPSSQVFEPGDTTKDPLADFKTLQLMWQECPPPQADAEMIKRFAAIGLAQGETDGFAKLSNATRRGLARAEHEARELVTATAQRIPGRTTAHSWASPLATIGIFDDGNYLFRAAVTLLGTIALPFSENIYMFLQSEPGTTTQLSGDARYTLRIPPGDFPRVGAFWSIHAYSFEFKVIANEINRYAIGDRSKFNLDADGGLTVLIQADDPGGERHNNWLPVKKGKPFFLITREYEPGAGPGAMRWLGPEVRRIV